MKTRPILFSTEMVRAILDGNKTMTRRKTKLQPGECEYYEKLSPNEWAYISIGGMSGPYKCPYGQVGDVLWVKETFTVLDWNIDMDIHIMYQDATTQIKTLNIFEFIKFLAWQNKEGKKSSLFMFKSLSRIRLRITDIRVERLQKITWDDAVAEGCRGYRPMQDEPTDHFKRLWQSINGRDSWDANPYVWVIQFKKI